MGGLTCALREIKAIFTTMLWLDRIWHDDRISFLFESAWYIFIFNLLVCKHIHQSKGIVVSQRPPYCLSSMERKKRNFLWHDKETLLETFLNWHNTIFLDGFPSRERGCNLEPWMLTPCKMGALQSRVHIEQCCRQNTVAWYDDYSAEVDISQFFIQKIISSSLKEINLI